MVYWDAFDETVALLRSWLPGDQAGGRRAAGG
jgi:hypothetical protein